MRWTRGSGIRDTSIHPTAEGGPMTRTSRPEQERDAREPSTPLWRAQTAPGGTRRTHAPGSDRQVVGPQARRRRFAEATMRPPATTTAAAAPSPTAGTSAGSSELSTSLGATAGAGAGRSRSAALLEPAPVTRRLEDEEDRPCSAALLEPAPVTRRLEDEEDGPCSAALLEPAPVTRRLEEEDEEEEDEPCSAALLEPAPSAWALEDEEQDTPVPPPDVPHCTETGEGDGSRICDEEAGPTRVRDSAADAPSAAATRRRGRLLLVLD
ncbi:hypothetical protein FHX52_2197 [Humibacillus xanthopallidus]|uniref:Uncharacterized protein n=1 Tax=Humibacillus xanthopallidus TaxID=412689 RepID=A0A543PY86_9MICO|nr:hypothetical protein FHX52_2197 [Humibacillus xanthopallidus]